MELCEIQRKVGIHLGVISKYTLNKLQENHKFTQHMHIRKNNSKFRGSISVQ